MEIHPVLKKLQFKDHGQAVLIVNPPKSYHEVMEYFQGEVHQHSVFEEYDFIQVFGIANSELQAAALSVVGFLKNDGLFWLCYPKKNSKVYKGSNCSRETVTGLLASHGYEPVRQVAVDDDWSALRFRKTEHIKKMTRNFAVTEEGKKRTGHTE